MDQQSERSRSISNGMIIGITGTIGAGKGEVVRYLVDSKNFAHFSVRDLLTEEIKKRRFPMTRDSMRLVANEIRKTRNPSYIIESLYGRAAASGKDAVVESVRALAEADFLKSKGATLLAVDADRRLRYDRIVSRGSSTDKVDFDTWVAQEERELAATDPWDMNVLGVMGKADHRMYNNGTLEELHGRIDEMLATLTK
ncbi:MAG TPA: AAA family ATPase [Candidatus Paceibacterota bacterium]|nr:AAA family ATPase [Candidatus Paceibacterota bacterium]